MTTALAIVGTTCAYALCIGLIFIPLEELASRTESRRRSYAPDIGWATLGASLGHLLLWMVAPIVLATAAQLRVADIGAYLPIWLTIPAGLIVLDLAGYAYHRASHHLIVLRRLHALHHQSEHVDFLSTFRQHPLEMAMMALAQNLPLVLLGLPLIDHVGLLLLLRLHAVFIHANVAVPSGWSTFIVTPDLHHRHHAQTGRTANYAHLFPFIDRLFGTYETSVSGRHGTDGPHAPQSSLWSSSPKA